MGAWGPDIFSDDLAADVREEYIELIGDGMTSKEATVALIQRYKLEANDLDSGGTVFWLSLAKTESDYGRLLDFVKEKALEIINSGADLKELEASPGTIEERKRVLEDLKRQLLSPQPLPKNILKKFKDSTGFEVGDIISYRTLSNKLVLFRVIGHHEDHGGRAPVVEILDWDGDINPSPEEVSKLKVKAAGQENSGDSQFLIGSVAKKDFPSERVSLVLKGSTPSQKVGSFAGYPWRHLDMLLEREFGIK